MEQPSLYIRLLVKKGCFYHLIQTKLLFDSEKRAILVKKRCFQNDFSRSSTLFIDNKGV